MVSHLLRSTSSKTDSDGTSSEFGGPNGELVAEGSVQSSFDPSNFVSFLESPISSSESQVDQSRMLLNQSIISARLFHFDQLRPPHEYRSKLSAAFWRQNGLPPLKLVIDDGKHDSESAMNTFLSFLEVILDTNNYYLPSSSDNDDWVYVIEDCRCVSFVFLLQQMKGSDVFKNLFVYRYWNSWNSDMLVVVPRMVED